MPEGHRTHNTRYQISTAEMGELTAPLNILPQSTAMTLTLPERHEAETHVGRPMAAAVSAQAATARHL